MFGSNRTKPTCGLSGSDFSILLPHLTPAPPPTQPNALRFVKMKVYTVPFLMKDKPVFNVE